MNVNYIEHIGIAVKSIEESIPYFEKLLGIKCKGIENIQDQSVNTAIFEIGMTKIELLESTNSESPIAGFIDKRGEGIHHIAFAVDNTDNALILAKENGFRLIDKKSRKGADGLNIGFLNPKFTNGVLIEFCSK